MPDCYPVSLNIKGRLCVVVGGGKVAERKVLSLLECGARVRQVSPVAVDGLKQLARAGSIERIEDCYRESHLEGAFLVIGATGDNSTNAMVSADSMSKGLLVNVVDDPPRGNFYVPAVVRRGPLQVAVSTDGRSPMLARKIREHLEEVFPPAYGELVEMVGLFRENIIRDAASPGEKEKLLAALLDDVATGLLREGKIEPAKERIRDAYFGGGGKSPDSSG